MTICNSCLRPKIHPNFIDTLGKRLHQLRMQHYLSLQDVSDKINTSKSHICLIEKDKRNPSIDNLLQLSILFDVPTDYLLKGM